MSRAKKSKFNKFLVWVLLLLLLVGGIVGVVRFTGISKDDINDYINPEYKVTYNGSVFKSDTENFVLLPCEGTAKFTVKGANSYTVKIVPNVTDETDFEYYVGDNSYLFSGETSLTSVFDIETYDSYFTINCDNDYSLSGVLSAIWGGRDDITVSNPSFSPYKMVVTSSSGDVINIVFAQYSDVKVTSVNLTQNNIVM
jgi:hypothetical protein